MNPPTFNNTTVQFYPKGNPKYRLIALWYFLVLLTVWNILGHLYLGFEQPWVAPFVGVASFDGLNAPIAGASEPQIVPAVAEPEFAPVTRLPSGEMVLPLATRNGAITVIEISNDLRTWTPVWTNSPGNPLLRDLPQNLPAGRYYRSVEP